MDGLARFQDQPDSEVLVRVVDLDNLKCISGAAVNIGEWGCRIVGDDVSKLYRHIAIQIEDEVDMTRAEVTSVKGREASVIFKKTEVKGADKRRERRNNVQIMVKVSDPESGDEVTGTIVDAGKNGCRIKATGLAEFPDRVILTMSKFDKPVPAEFAWRTESQAGFRLYWNEAKADQ